MSKKKEEYVILCGRKVRVCYISYDNPKCSLCGKKIRGIPYRLFRNGGEKGEIDLCEKCFKELFTFTKEGELKCKEREERET